MGNILELIVTPEFLIIAVGVIFSFLILVAILKPALSGDKIKDRMNEVINQTNAMRLESLSGIESGGNLREDTTGKVKNLVEKFNLIKLLEVKGLRKKMIQAGFRKQSHIYKFYFFRFAMPVALFLIFIFYFGVINPFKMAAPTVFLASMVGALLGFYLPVLYIKNKADKRRDAVMMIFPDALDLILISIESGMSLEATFDIVSKKLVNASVELAEEMALTKAELSYLPSRIKAFENLTERVDHVSIKAVIAAFIQTERYGTPLGKTLRIMSEEIRKLRITQIEKKAASLPSKLAGPTVLFFMPVMSLLIGAPAMYKVMDALKGGSGF